jgi:hypothetical protein
VKGGLDYALLKRHYDNDDFVSIGYGANEDYYVVGTMAYLNDPTVATAHPGWGSFTHGQPAAPTFLAAILAALGVSWPAITPAFEAKDILFYASTDCYVRFEGSSRVQHLIPVTTFVRFHRRCLMFFIQRVLADGTLYVWLEG